MRKTILGKDLEVSVVGLGTMGFTHAYGPAMDEKEAANVIREAVSMGYTFFDTEGKQIKTLKRGIYLYSESKINH